MTYFTPHPRSVRAAAVSVRQSAAGQSVAAPVTHSPPTDRGRVQHATEEGRLTGVRPSGCSWKPARSLTPEQLSHAIAERYGLDHLDLGVFKIDMGAANLLNASAARPYAAVPVGHRRADHPHEPLRRGGAGANAGL